MIYDLENNSKKPQYTCKAICTVGRSVWRLHSCSQWSSDHQMAVWYFQFLMCVCLHVMCGFHISVFLWRSSWHIHKIQHWNSAVVPAWHWFICIQLIRQNHESLGHRNSEGVSMSVSARLLIYLVIFSFLVFLIIFSMYSYIHIFLFSLLVSC